MARAKQHNGEKMEAPMSATDGERHLCRSLRVVSLPSNVNLSQMPKVGSLLAEGRQIVARGTIVVHRDITERKLTEESIRDLSSRLIHAQEEERSRIARELHDDISQQLVLLGIEIQLVEEAIPETAASLRASLKEIWKRTHETAQDVQRISHQLHSSKLEHLGLPSALKGLLQEFTRLHQVGGETQFRDIPTPLDREVSLTLFRVAQEALRNAGKHSGAKNIRIELIGETAGLLLRISDDGVGFDPSVKPSYGLGIISMEERLRLVNGKLSLWSRVGSGTQVEAFIPLTAQPVSKHEASLAVPPLRSWRNDELPDCIQFSACS
jgi:signal transduction histidine kinase